MKVLIIAVFFAAAITAVSVARAKEKPGIPRARYDEVSYAIGAQFASQVYELDRTALDGELDPKQIARAVRDVFAGRGRVTREEAEAIMQQFFTVDMLAENMRKSEEYMRKAALNPLVRTTGSGLMYEIIEQGDMGAVAVDDRDVVEVLYVGRLRDGSEFDRNDDGMFVELGRVIVGWNEGLRLIGKGGRIRLIVPPSLAYGEVGAPGAVGPNAVLDFDVRLLDVIRHDPPDDGITEEAMH